MKFIRFVIFFILSFYLSLFRGFILSFFHFFILSFFRNILECLLQQLPEGLYGSDEGTLGSGVR